MANGPPVDKSLGGFEKQDKEVLDMKEFIARSTEKEVARCRIMKLLTKVWRLLSMQSAQL